MPKIHISLKKKNNDSYNIIIEPNIVDKLSEELKKHNYGEKYCIITDSKTKQLFGGKLLKKLKKSKIQAELISFTSGEKAKKLNTIEILAEKMFTSRFNRKDCIIALGGGVVGDIAGFLSAIYMRGINYIQIPTTLLSMVDSSVGGKTGVNLKTGKNMLGAFKQPKNVYIDSNFLETLPLKEIQNGLAEIIKYGVIMDKSFFKYLEKNIPCIFKVPKGSKLNFNHKVLNKIITESCKNKAYIVKKDEKESKLRMILNYGHTYGHAIEQTSNYKIPHGQGVALGMTIINEKAVKKGILKKKQSDRITNLLKATGLSTKLPKNMKLSDLQKLIKNDKKATTKHINIILPTKIGKVKITKMKI